MIKFLNMLRTMLTVLPNTNVIDLQGKKKLHLDSYIAISIFKTKTKTKN